MSIWPLGMLVSFIVGAVSFFGFFGSFGEKLIIPAFIAFVFFGTLWGFAEQSGLPAPEMCGSGRFEWEC